MLPLSKGLQRCRVVLRTDTASVHCIFTEKEIKNKKVYIGFFFFKQTLQMQVGDYVALTEVW